MNARRILTAMFLVIGAAVVMSLGRGGDRLVPPGRSVQAAVDAAAPGDTVVLQAGEHRGPVVIEGAIELAGEPGAELIAPPGAAAVITVSGTGAMVSSLAVVGGDSGIVVREAEEVDVVDVWVRGATHHGIEVVDAAAEIDGAVVSGLVGEMSQGIEIRNADGRPDSVVRNSHVSGGMGGIVSHVSEVQFRDNVVEGTTLRGIDVTEMSDGVVTNNVVADAAGAGIYCGDMSRCALEHNRVGPIAATDGGRSAGGWGLVVTYHASAWERGNEWRGTAGEVLTSLDGKLRARNPLDPGEPADVLAPMALALFVTGLLVLAGLGTARLLRRYWAAPRQERSLPRLSIVAAVIAATVVQTFHMIEHLLQVYRIEVDHIPSRGGLAGPAVDAEWVHMAYNGSVLLLIVVAVIVLRGRLTNGPTSLLVAAAVVQAWHTVEHVAKVTQHVVTGHKVNPGLLGDFFNLYWFHFTINLAVYVPCLIAALLVLWELRPTRLAEAPLRQPVGA